MKLKESKILNINNEMSKKNRFGKLDSKSGQTARQKVEEMIKDQIKLRKNSIIIFEAPERFSFG